MKRKFLAASITIISILCASLSVGAASQGIPVNAPEAFSSQDADSIDKENCTPIVGLDAPTNHGFIETHSLIIHLD